MKSSARLIFLILITAGILLATSLITEPMYKQNASPVLGVILTLSSAFFPLSLFFLLAVALGWVHELDSTRIKEKKEREAQGKIPWHKASLRFIFWHLLIIAAPISYLYTSLMGRKYGELFIPRDPTREPVPLLFTFFVLLLVGSMIALGIVLYFVLT